MSRNYLPKLSGLLLGLCKYMQRYQTTIYTFLTTDPERTAFQAVITACQALEAIVEGKLTPPS